MEESKSGTYEESKLNEAYNKAKEEGLVDENSEQIVEKLNSIEINRPDPEGLFRNRKKRRDFYKNINKSRTWRHTEFVYKYYVHNGKMTKRKIKKYIIEPNVVIREKFPNRLSWGIMPKMTREQAYEKSISLGFECSPIKKILKARANSVQ